MKLSVVYLDGAASQKINSEGKVCKSVIVLDGSSGVFYLVAQVFFCVWSSNAPNWRQSQQALCEDLNWKWIVKLLIVACSKRIVYLIVLILYKQNKWEKMKLCPRNATGMFVSVITLPLHCSNVMRTFCVSWDVESWSRRPWCLRNGTQLLRMLCPNLKSVCRTLVIHIATVSNA